MPVEQVDSEYAALGWQNSALGFPTSDETDTARHDGRFNNFQYGNIYWSPGTGAHEVHGAIREQYLRVGAENGRLGYPISDESPAPDGVGRISTFEHGSMYWAARTGARVELTR